MSFEIELVGQYGATVSTVLAFTKSSEGVNVAYVQPGKKSDFYEEGTGPTEMKTVDLPVSYEDFKKLSIESKASGNIPSFKIG